MMNPTPLRTTITHTLSGWLLTLALLPGPVAAVSEKVSELIYRESLFHYYQQHPFTAATHLMVADRQQQLGDKQTEADLLLAGIQLSYGMHQRAQAEFESQVENITGDRAWYQLARLQQRRAYPEAALNNLQRLDAGKHRLYQKQAMIGQLLLQQGRADEAVFVLQQGKKTQKTEKKKRDKAVIKQARYSDYNLAVAQLLSGQTAEALELLTRMGERKAKGEEQHALRDRSNLTLALQHLAASSPDAANRALDRIRLDGPYGNRALLAAGWADHQLQDYRDSITPWTLLSQRNPVDPAVQESLLTLPQTYLKLGAQREAASAYQHAINAYQAASDELSATLTRIQHEGIDPFASPDKDPMLSLLIPGVMAAHPFQEGLKNLRDLDFLKYKLERWQAQLPVYKQMLETRQQRYEREAPRAQREINATRITQLHARYEALQQQLATIEQSSQSEALATLEEQQQRAKLASIKRRLNRFPIEADGSHSAMLTDLHHKQRIFSGLLQWQLQQAYPERLWQAQKLLKTLKQPLDQIASQGQQITAALIELPKGFQGFALRINEQRSRISQLQQRVEENHLAQKEALQQLVMNTLQQSRERLAQYQVQARYALAQLYDRAEPIPLKPQPAVQNEVSAP
ncbi:hypothetical protein BOW53_11105 [Solemya pervernicosa gill symbiont]|uniref:Tetratricopeptide repeat-like domain-containing protein n=1 Tax=Solemya pervernicosa gill symbiont TaxID=642797 RepID=A0A1T2L360_9GAMM|nr:hypothetical protein [Solemya pervernicosa gill symbiont]OOZ39533.1 hypothetical protein BOW53_11105 [Solemya pervernicosa gill symbiont]